MRYFDYLTDEEKREIFYRIPEEINEKSPREILAYGLGPTLYMPATRDNIVQDMIQRKLKGLTSMVLCLEDAIGDQEVERAEELLAKTMNTMSEAMQKGKIKKNQTPFVFIRVRSPEQIGKVVHMLGENRRLIKGFVFPKFTHEKGRQYFESLKEMNRRFSQQYQGMPILESAEIIYREKRSEELEKIAGLLQQYQEEVLNVRIGATDFSSLFGIRRNYDVTIYDIGVIRDCIADIVNAFCRVDRGFVVSGPVWEYFLKGSRVLKPQLRQSPFEEAYGNEGLQIREKILDKYIDGLIREVLLDKANGLVGKTIIHPSHILPVQALHVVSHEEYVDAISILENNKGALGVMKSEYANKMNEVKPHLNWARKTIIKSKIYGVFHENKNFTNLFTAKSHL